MAFTGDEYARRTLDFVERLQRLEDYDAICRHIVQELEWFGFTCVSSWSIPGPGDNPAACLLLNTRPKDYVDHYIDKNYVVRDPVITELRRSVRPFSWGDLRRDRSLSRPERAIMDEARDFDGHDGLIVPIVTLSGSVSVFSPCGRAPDVSQRARAAVEIIGMYSYEALKRALVRNQRGDAARAPLTPREREIMHWVAAGKSDDEIGEILGIGATTVTAHVENAKRKLDAFRRTYAVVQAIRFGEIAI